MKLGIEKSGVQVRLLQAEDYPAWRKAYLSILSIQGNRWDIPPKSEEEVGKQHFLDLLHVQRGHRDQDRSYAFGVFLHDGAMVGDLSLMNLTRGVFQNAFLGYRIFNNQWGNGYGKLAVKAGIEIAFTQLNLHRVEAGIEPDNVRSVALVKSLNMRYEGLSEKRIFMKGKWLDLALYVLTSEDLGIEWDPSREKPFHRKERSMNV
jgi:ribosomal-protein-alanine N-acetyltransferase